MLYDVGKILRDTRIVLDRNGDDRDLLPVDFNTQLLDELIVREVEDSVRNVVNGAPVELLDSVHNIMGDEPGGPSIRWQNRGLTVVGSIVLPADFLRLVAFKMSDWERTVYDIVTEGSKEYQLQSSRFAGVRGTPQKPVVAIIRTQYGLELEFFSCKSDEAEVEKAVYQPYPRIMDGGAIEIPERCYRAVVMTLAAMAMSNVGESDRATAYFEMSKQVLI